MILPLSSFGFISIILALSRNIPGFTKYFFLLLQNFKLELLLSSTQIFVLILFVLLFVSVANATVL